MQSLSFKFFYNLVLKDNVRLSKSKKIIEHNTTTITTNNNNNIIRTKMTWIKINSKTVVRNKNTNGRVAVVLDNSE